MLVFYVFICLLAFEEALAYYKERVERMEELKLHKKDTDRHELRHNTDTHTHTDVHAASVIVVALQ